MYMGEHCSAESALYTLRVQWHRVFTGCSNLRHVLDPFSSQKCKLQGNESSGTLVKSQFPEL